jgi:hypothetical protein
LLVTRNSFSVTDHPPMAFAGIVYAFRAVRNPYVRRPLWRA